MPLYDYKCHKCGKVFEVRQNFSDERLKVHEECGGELERLISAPALQFKGSGWYITDYAKSNSSSAGKSNGGSESKGDSSGSKSSDSSSSSSSSSSESKPSTTTTSSTDKK